MAKKKNSSSNNNNNTSNVVEKKEGGENKKGGNGVEKKQENSPVPVVLKVEMHCDGCVSTILKSVRSFEGVESVEAEATSNKLTVTGKVDPLKIRDYLNHKTKKKVELISPQPQKQDTSKNNNNKEDKKSNDKKPDTDAKPKEAPVITAVLKLEFHCQGCIEKIDKIVHKTKGVHERVLDKQKELVTVKGTMDVKALAETLKSRLKRAVDIVPPKKEKEKEKEKEGGKDGENAAGGGGGKKKGGGGNGGQDAAAAAAATKSRREPDGVHGATWVWTWIWVRGSANPWKWVHGSANPWKWLRGSANPWKWLRGSANPWKWLRGSACLCSIWTGLQVRVWIRARTGSGLPGSYAVQRREPECLLYIVSSHSLKKKKKSENVNNE
ncbi:HEAVY METAL-ASSOCIATED ISOPRENYLATED PLANT PROTEIN 6 [Salix purpurea]|uniref:HEAVY METAL-ASSOCIATED ISOPRENYLATED PLANT PROTEIN 6 n=1 Tax=Salix purpurea TaxID=77065 RepID=A0A9Q1ABZ3_SALPP|nr:HEAVY METAL-ASSOCIATED ISOPRENYLATED PLANT PROTEIN 6 [Salix purpurea]